MFGTKTSARSRCGRRRLRKIAPLTVPILAMLFAFGQAQLLAEETSPLLLSLETALNTRSRQPARFVLTDGKTVIGRVVKISDDALTIRRPSARLQTLPLETIASLNIKENDGSLIHGRIVRMADGTVGWQADGKSPSHTDFAGTGPDATMETGGPLIRLDTETQEQRDLLAGGATPTLAAVEPSTPTPNDANAKPNPVQLQITVDDANESDKFVYFRLTLSEPAPRSILIIYTMVNGSAVAPSDVRHRQGTIVFEPGQTHATVAVSIVNDETAEETESFGFFVTGDPSAVNINQRMVTATITDDDS